MARNTTTRTTPLFFQSKPFCASCLYLTFTLILSFYLTVSPTSKCILILKSSKFVPLQSPLFSYPSSYGQHKHSLPTLRASCSSPVFFSDYRRVFNEIDELSRNSTSSSSGNVKYMQQGIDQINSKAGFGGNFSTEERLSFFDHPPERNRTTDDDQLSGIPCGFLQPFPVNFDDTTAMNNCNGLVILSAIFANHDKIRQPSGLGSRTLESVCFFIFIDDTTLTTLQSQQIIPTEEYHKVGVWRLVKVDTNSLYDNPAMNGVIPKYLVHRLFPNAKYSVWLDAKLQLVVDPLLLVHSLVVKEGVDIAVSKHPFFVNTMEEAMATARWRKWSDVDELRLQMESYCENGMKPWSNKKLPYPSDVPDTALILRKHGEANAVFSCLMFNELNAYSHRDQLAFAFVRDKMTKPNKIKINMFEAEVFEQTVREFRHNINHTSSNNNNNEPKKQNAPVFKRAKPERGLDFKRNLGLGKCKNYFQEMWGDE